ncbi:hypothetical protein C8P64_0472 [Christiangramia gaetbulicola]|uniref:Uncharacterized protein n=1 Tax=Christiangramia gaetbulicola TaxID=703340 RepID=A0A2T6AKZ2_9FLAO|nr:hypothetical protein C8P64_0472 [Christiangramia gaetbulicola]
MNIVHCSLFIEKTAFDCAQSDRPYRTKNHKILNTFYSLKITNYEHRTTNYHRFLPSLEITLEVRILKILYNNCLLFIVFARLRRSNLNYSIQIKELQTKGYILKTMSYKHRTKNHKLKKPELSFRLFALCWPTRATILF